MIDRDQLREAIRTFESWQKLTRERNPEAYDRIAAMPGSAQPVYALLLEAARLVVAGREVWWCEEHEQAVWIDGGKVCMARATGVFGDCRMVRTILIDGGEA